MTGKRSEGKTPPKRANEIVLATMLIAPMVPFFLDWAGLLIRPENTLVRAGNSLYAAALILLLLYVCVRIRRIKRKNSLTGIWSGQGFASVLVGASGLLMLGLTAPLFPEQTLGVYLAGAGIVVLFALIPMALFHYVARKLDVRDPADR